MNIPINDNLWPQEQWDNRYVQYQFKAAGPTDPLRLWLERCFREKKAGSCLEMGCFPGHYLAVFGELGWELNGIDLTPRVDVEMAGWLRSRGHHVGSIVRDDFFTHPFNRRFDVVCSFGLIEHFVDWPRALARHAELVAPGGHLVVTTPNFRGAVQNALHRLLDQENLARHNVEAMDPRLWAEEAEKLGLRVVEYGGLGSFDFWAEPQQRSVPARCAIKAIRKIKPLLNRITPSGPLMYAPYCRILAKRGTED